MVMKSMNSYHMFLDLWSEISLFNKFIYAMSQGSIFISLDVTISLLHKLIYYMAQGSIVIIGLDFAVRLRRHVWMWFMCTLC